jgi:omega-amidase
MNQSLTLTLIQTSLYWEDKQANMAQLEEKIMGIPEKTELVILPEMFSTGFSMSPQTLAETMGSHTMAWMKKVASAKKIILTGSIIISEQGQYYNRMIWMLPNGTFGYYDKRHLFAYAGEDKHYAPGAKRLVASVKGWRVLLQVCYDLRFPVWSRQAYKTQEVNEKILEYDLLIYVANWPDKRRHAWNTLLQARAIENQCFVAGVNRVGKDANGHLYTGDSMIANPLGEIVYHKQNEEDVFTMTLFKEEVDGIREKLPFWKDGDMFRILES